MSSGPTGPGKIVTFYSYKGGTGRTMALANVGWILAAGGHRVLLVDWDLEAPGLHRYLHPLLVDPELRSSNGLINMVQAYVRTVLSPQAPPVRATADGGSEVRPAATAVSEDDGWLRAAADPTPYTIGLLLELPSWGRLDFLPAGRQSAAYSAAVTSFNWHSFYGRHGGGHFLQALREEMISAYDYVLIDSRTGVSDTSGICTILLPDIVVDCFTMNVQSISGGVDAAAAVRRTAPRPIKVLPVPMRVEEAETERLEAGRDFSRAEFDAFLDWMPEEKRSRYWGEIEIPYKAFYAYEEIPATVADRPRQERSLLTAFERLTDWISEGRVRHFAPLPADRRAELRAAYLRTPRTLPTQVYVSYAPLGRIWAEWVAEALESVGYQVSLHSTVGPDNAILPEVSGTLNGLGRVLALLSPEYADQPRAVAIRSQLAGHETVSGSGLVAVRLQDLDPAAAEPYLHSPAADLSRRGPVEAFDQLLAVLGLPPGRRLPDGSAPAAATLPSFPGSIPAALSLPSRNLSFTGRGPLLERLRDHFTAGPTAAVPSQVLYGFGGMGKTQIALEYAHRYKSAYDVIWWMNAEQPGSIHSALGALAPYLGLEQSEDARSTADAVLRALGQGRPYKRWLLVYDNAGSPTRLARLLPQGPPGGHVLITSRDRAWITNAGRAEVEVFTRAESLELLHRFSPQLSAEDAGQVAHELGDLPLAVGQAAVWLSQSSMPVDIYLARLRDRPADILKETRLPDREYPHSAARTWQIAVEELGRDNQAAVEMLEICSFFGPDPIPMRLLYSRSVTHALTLDEGEPRDEMAVAQLLRALNRFGLARSDQGSETLSVHRLVQAVIRDGVGAPRWKELRAVVHTALADANPGNPEATTDWDEYDQLLPHLEPSRAAADPHPEVRKLIIDSVRYLWKRSLYDPAHDLAVGTLECWSRPDFPGGSDDAQTLLLRTQLGNVLRWQGRLAEAYELDSEVLRRFTATRGAEYPATLAAACNVGADLRALGRYQEARELDRTTHQVALREFGEDHQRTLMYTNNLGMSEYLAGDRRAALELHRSAYERQRQNQGSMKPRTLNLANNYARDLRETGELAEALRLLKTTTRLYQQVLGDGHSDTLRARKNLAVALRRAGRYAEAHDIDRDVYNRYLDTHGRDHYDTLAAACNLACDLSALGDIEQAHNLAGRALTRYKDYLGGEHPVTLVCASNIAVYLRLLGRTDEALASSQRTMEQLRAALGEFHPYTLSCVLNHANDLVAAGRVQEAADLETRVREGLLASVGPDHYGVVGCTSNLSLSLRALNRTAEADELRKDALARIRRTLGADHPTTLAIEAGARLDSDIEPPTT